MAQRAKLAMNITTIIVDDFLENPSYVRSTALELDFSSQGNFPGARSCNSSDAYNAMIIEKLENILNKKIINWIDHVNPDTNSIEQLDTSCFQLCLSEEKTWIHRDPADDTAILYLSPDAPVEAGTAIYRHKTSGVYKYIESNIVDDPDINSWEIITFIGNVFNRLVIFQGCLFHKSVLPGFGYNKYTGRLTHTFFFNVKK